METGRKDGGDDDWWLNFITFGTPLGKELVIVKGKWN